MKKAWILMLALVLMMFVSAQAKMKQCGDYYYTVLEDGTIEITVYTGEESELVLPSELDGYKVTAIGDFAFQSTDLEFLTIPEGIERIGVNPFKDCYYLEKIAVAPGNPRFEVRSNALIDTVDQVLICYPNDAEIDAYQIPDGVVTVGGYAFVEHYPTSVVFPESCREIGPHAFDYCLDLEKIVMQGGIENIGESAFQDCIDLREVQFSSNLKVIGQNTFLNCSELTTALLPEGLVEIGSNTLDRGFSGPGALRIPASLERIGEFSLHGSELIEVYEGSVGHKYALINSGDIDFALINESEE